MAAVTMADVQRHATTEGKPDCREDFGFKDASKAYSDQMMKLGMKFMRWIADVVQGRQIRTDDGVTGAGEPAATTHGATEQHTEHHGRHGELSTDLAITLPRNPPLDPLDPSIFARYFDGSSIRGGRIKFVRYPPAGSKDLVGVENGQGVGPHRDLWLTFLLHANDLPGLQVQARDGTWLSVPPIPNSFAVTVGQALESVTHGILLATHHCATIPPPGSPARITIPYFMDISGDTTLGMIKEGLEVGEGGLEKRMVEWARWRRWEEERRKRAKLAATARMRIQCGNGDGASASSCPAVTPLSVANPTTEAPSTPSSTTAPTQPPVTTPPDLSSTSDITTRTITPDSAPPWQPTESSTLRELHFRGMLARRPQVGRRWYPEMMAEIEAQGNPVSGAGTRNEKGETNSDM
ncbi:hypothetical protein HDU93_008364 [Gonapodya sp. JEL0774]|nr:hypothetical protein HDU93_008364 [Gonapodya sp. JEL0774]